MTNARLNPRQRKHLSWRLVAFVVLHLLIAVHLISWYGFDKRLVGAIDMQELFRNLIEKNVLTAGALFFLVFLGVSLLWGRIFCGWMCHVGQVYDLLAALARRLGWRTPSFPTRLGPMMAVFILLWYFLGEALKTREEGPFQVAWGATEPWELLPGWLVGSSLLVVVWLVLPALMGPRGFCRNLCPWGVLLGLGNRLAPWKVRRVGSCTNCGRCNDQCPMDIDVSRAINTRFSVQTPACTNCLQCVTACPTEALAFALPSREQRAPRKLDLLPKIPRLAWGTELAFWTATLLVGLVYDRIYGLGIFLAYSLGLVLAWLTVKLPSILRQKQKFAPILLLVVLLAWANVGKDALADYHWRHGHIAFARQDMDAGQRHYERADQLFWSTPTVLLYRLYTIYKRTGQETKRQALYERYERRRVGSKKGADP